MVVFLIVGKSEPLYELDFTAPTQTQTQTGGVGVGVVAGGAGGVGGGGSYGGQTLTQTPTPSSLPSPIGASAADMPTLDMSYLHQFILHSSLDMAHNTMWTNPAS